MLLVATSTNAVSLNTAAKSEISSNASAEVEISLNNSIERKMSGEHDQQPPGQNVDMVEEQSEPAATQQAGAAQSQPQL